VPSPVRWQTGRVNTSVSHPAGPGPDLPAWLATARVADEVLALRPDYAAVLIAADGLRPGPSDEASDAILAAAEARAVKHLAGSRPEELAEVAQWREAFRGFGAKPQRTRPSVEALLRRLESGLPRIDRITDVYNALSIAFLLPVGGEDLAHYAGPARLVRAAGDEDFDTVAAGEPAVEHPEPGEVIWCDDRGVTCRRWNWRQCTRTRITATTTTALFILDGLAALGTDGLRAAADELTGSLARLSPQARFASRLLGPS
jgi:DNA/RNA-binding domain of Phe-tRNA-synthetase-like protein